MKNHLILGDWNALCDSCGRKFKASSLKKRWDGLIVCKEDWEQRHPQDLLRVQREQISVPWSRPYPAEDTFIPWNYTDYEKDSIDINELAAMAVLKRIGYDSTNSGYNSYAFNAYSLNAEGISSSNAAEHITFNETFLAALARSLTDTTTLVEAIVKSTTKYFADTVSISESVWFAEEEHNVDSLSLTEFKALVVTKVLTETFSVTESTTYKLSSTTALNGAALNTKTLG